jgi:GntR family transcriptional repressor for pyruvate dehydrogenase complex
VRSFTSVKSARISELIAEQIRATILDGTMKPGDSLPPERVLAEHFEASRVAIREALKNLEASGLIIIKPGSGVFVTSVTSKAMSESLYSILRMQKTSMNEVTEARLILEPHIARLASERAVEKDFAALEANIEEATRALGEGKPPTMENIEFHAILAAMMHNTVIDLMIRTLLDVMNTMYSDFTENQTERIEIAGRSLNQHRKILQTLKERDAEKVYQLMLEHIIEIQGGLRKVVSRSDIEER